MPAPVARGRGRLRRSYDEFDRQLCDSRFIAGAAFSVADSYTLCTIDFARWCRLMILKHRVGLQRWDAKGSARQSAKA
jgi:glutathione S-transferase